MRHSPGIKSTALAIILLMGLAGPVLAANVSGMIKSIDQEHDEFVVQDSVDRNWTFYLSKTAKVYLKNKEVRLSDLRPGDMATVTYEVKEGNNLMAVELRCRRK